MGLANDLKGLNMLGRFAPNSLALLAVLIVILQCVYNNPALGKPRPQLVQNTDKRTGDDINRQWSNINSIVNPQRQKRRVSEQEDILKDQNGFKILTDINTKREGIQTPIEPLKDSTVSNHGSNLKSLNQANGDKKGITEVAPNNADAISTASRSGISSSTSNDATSSGSSLNSGNNDANGQKREEVSKTSDDKNTANDDKPKQESTASTNDKPKNTKPQESHSVTIQGNTVNGKPISSSSPEPGRDPVGNSGSEVVTSHPLFENRAENERRPYLDTRTGGGGGGGGGGGDSKESSNEPEVGHFQVDDKSADLEINANSAGVKVKAKPASLQVVSRPGPHPSTPIVPIAPVHPYYHHHHHPYFYGYRRSSRPYHRRLYNNPYHAHYR